MSFSRPSLSFASSSPSGLAPKAMRRISEVVWYISTAFWAAAFQNGLKAMVLTTVDVERHMDVAVETGRFRLTVDVHGKPVESAGKYVVVWKKQPSGVWQLHRDIWNAAPPAK